MWDIQFNELLTLLVEETIAEELGDVITVEEVISGDTVVGPAAMGDDVADITSLLDDGRTELVDVPLSAVVERGGTAPEAFAAGIASGTSVVFFVSGVVDSPHELAGFVRAPL